jgi:hypothetical protein
MSIGTGAALGIGGAVSGIGSLFGASTQANAATQAAQIQANAAEQASQLQYNMFEQVQNEMMPFYGAGVTAETALINNTLSPGGYTTMPTTWGMQNEFSPTMDSLAQTPGYQFTLQQGQQAITNQYAAQGLGGSITGGQAGPSGPLAAAQTQFAGGTAANTFNQQYQNWLAGQNLQISQKQTAYNMTGGIAGSGQNAGANLGALGLQTAGAAGNYLTSGAAASAGGVVGAANALTAGATNLGNTAQSTALALALNNNGMFGQAPSTPTATPGYVLGSDQA